MRPLTPTQKAVGTNTYFIRAQIWFPDGSAIKAEIPWVDQLTGKRLTDEIVEAMKKPEKKTAEEWEEEARKGLEEKAAAKKLERAFRCLPIVKDVDWVQQPSSRPMRGIIDNARDITFSRELKLEELEIAKKYLAIDAYRRGKGWTGVSGYRTEDRPAFVYRFTTTWDSSD
jgi:hypothetical protein